MGFNYALENKKFDAEWEKTEKEYIAAGMASEAIEEMRRFDWELFKRRRIDSLHEQSMIASRFDDDDSDDTQSALFDKFLDAMSTSDDTSNHHSKYWWIEEVDNQKLAKTLLSLSDDNLDLIQLVYFEGFTQPEAAIKTGLPLRTVEYRLAAIRKKLKKNI